MSDAWSREEVEATVQDYFSMLSDEISGRPFNKAEHNRQLRTLLKGRSKGAVERKHQNISAILLQLGFVYISGYKPLGNFQGLLREVVVDVFEGQKQLMALVESQVAATADVPSIDDILTAMTDPPTLSAQSPRNLANYVRDAAPIPRKVDYVEREARNRSLGAAGEEFVVRFEQARLLKAGCDKLADRVERVSETQGDGLGFDVLSFEKSGADRLIEVKTTAYGPMTPFWVTRNEVAVSRAKEDRYHLYRAYNFRRQARLFARSGALETSFVLEPSQFVARIG